MIETTWDGQAASPEPPYGTTVIVRRRSGERFEYLLLHRSSSGGGQQGDWAWTPPAGARMPSEPVDDCAARELREETGLALAPCPTGFGTYDWPVYVAEAGAADAVALDAEHGEFRWVDLAEAIRLCKPEVAARPFRLMAAAGEGLAEETERGRPCPSSATAGPTPYADVNLLLERLVSDVKEALGERLIGVYLYGSLATGGFEPGRSDIDFLVVTAGELPEEVLPRLEAMHARIAASGLPWANRLEGSYIPREALRRYDPAHAHHPALRMDGTFAVDHHASDWVLQLHLIREQGIALTGPDPRRLIDPVGPKELRQAVRAVIEEWWAPKLEDASRLHGAEYQAYAVLTMCRALYTLQHGAVVSKGTAAGWARQVLGSRWAALIDRALAWRLGAPWEGLGETIELIRYTVKRSREAS